MLLPNALWKYAKFGERNFYKYPERLVQNKPLSNYMSELLVIQDNLLKASAKELLRTD